MAHRGEANANGTLGRDPNLTKIKEPVKLIFELLFVLLALVPCMMWSLIEKFVAKPKSIKGKVALITGAGGGLGRGLALKFADLGCKVACVDVGDVENEITVKMINEKHPNCAKPYHCNIGSSEEIRLLRKNVESDFGCVNILVNNAGLLYNCKAHEVDEKMACGIVAINLTSHFMIVNEFLPAMLKRNEGHIVATASVAAFQSVSNFSVYSATKHGVLGFMESLDYELSEIPNNRIRTSVLCPYYIMTDPKYVKSWNLRIPPLSVRQVVDAALNGILTDQKIIFVPKSIGFSAVIHRLLPESINTMIRRIFYCRMLCGKDEKLIGSTKFRAAQEAISNHDKTK